MSGASALGVTAFIKKINQTVSKKVAIACTIYGAIMIVSYLAMPPNPDKISISMNLVEAFRLGSATTIVMFWESLGATYGTLWNRFNPQNLKKVTAF
ncbi:MAG: CbtA family protein [Thaumarchaeota archaeon]|nr:MAG: CbtA family protein [Nitrososphaerota archaeon]